MPNQLIFEIPRSTSARLEVLRIIPPWSSINGIIFASGNADVACGLGYLYTLDSMSVTTEADVGVRNPSSPNYKELSIDGKRPSFLRFERAGQCSASDKLTFAVCKQIIISYAASGYAGGRHGGSLTFIKANPPNSYEPMAQCLVSFGPQTGIVGMETDRERTRSRVEIEWDERYGGSQADVQCIIDLCRKLPNSREVNTMVQPCVPRADASTIVSA
jgi:hypothetical protein